MFIGTPLDGKYFSPILSKSLGSPDCLVTISDSLEDNPMMDVIVPHIFCLFELVWYPYFNLGIITTSFISEVSDCVTVDALPMVISSQHLVDP